MSPNAVITSIVTLALAIWFGIPWAAASLAARISIGG